MKPRKIKDLPPDERPRERLIKNGVNALSNAELLAIVLGKGIEKENVLSICMNILNKYDIKRLSRINIASLKKIKGIGEAKACQILACFELGRRLAGFKEKKALFIDSAKDVVKHVLPELLHIKNEHLVGIYLDARKRVIKKETLFVGSLNINILHPREIFRTALLESAAAVILVHNHPCGDPEPSDADIEVTKEIALGGELLGIELLDHVIVGGRTFVSMKDKGLI